MIHEIIANDYNNYCTLYYGDSKRAFLLNLLNSKIRFLYTMFLKCVSFNVYNIPIYFENGNIIINIFYVKYEVITFQKYYISLRKKQFIKIFIFHRATIFISAWWFHAVRFTIISHSAHSLSLFFWYIKLTGNIGRY